MPSPSSPTAAPPWYGQRVALFFGGYFILPGVALPFFPVWLEGRGLTAAEIASCVAIPMVVRVLATPAAGIFADRAPSRRFAIRIFTLASLLVFLLAWPATSYWPIMLATAVAMALYQLVLPAADALALTGLRRFGLDYGRMRLVGSATFILANLGAGALLGLVASEAIFWLMAGALVTGVMVSITLPLTPPAIRALDDAKRPERRSVRALLGNHALICLLVAGGLVQASHGVAYSFTSLYWQGLGYSGVEIGSLWAIGVICEILLFLWSGAAARRAGHVGLIAIGGVAAILRWSLLPFDLGYAGFVLVQSLHGLTFGATFLGVQHVIARLVPEEETASAQGVYSMASGILMAAFTALSGPLYGSLGSFAFATMIIPPMVALSILIIMRRRGALVSPR